MRIRVSGAAALSVALAPRIGAACSVCFSASDENRLAFTLTTVLLTALPLAMVGSFVFWLRRRVLRRPPLHEG